MKRKSVSLTVRAGRSIFSLLVLAASPFTNLVHAASSWDGKTSVEYVVTVEPDRPDAMYHVGETATFTIKLEHNKQPSSEGNIDWVISKDGVVPPMMKGSTTLQDGKVTVSGTLSEPGFLRCEASFKNGKDTIMAPAEAAFDPTDIKPSMPVPDDFDAFWAEKKKALAAVPINPKLTQVEVPAVYTANKPVEAFDFQADCVGNPASGYYARPKDAAPKSCPAILYVEGAGIRSAEIGVAARFGNHGFIGIDLNAHGLPNGQSKEFYEGLANGEMKDYRTRGRESRDTDYFVGMFLREIRAIDFLTSQPEWDGHTLIVEGVSQGGGQSLAATGLDPRVTFMVAGFPALCDHTGMVAGRIAGWPKLVQIGADGKPDPASLETSRYVDGVNFASRIKVPIYMWIGFVDSVTPPTCSYAAYNAITSKKELVTGPAYGHGRDAPDFWQVFNKKAFDEGAAEHAAAQSTPASTQ